MKKRPKVICLTGGPGAGKTSAADLIQRQFAEELRSMPEAASILYGGGFPRAQDPTEMKLVQEAIYDVQVRLEGVAKHRAHGLKALLCDRGTLDGSAYWPGSQKAFLDAVESDLKTELARYDLVIHLQSAHADQGYDRSNPHRIESAKEATLLDKKIQKAWKAHPKLYFVRNRASFLEKVEEVVSILKKELELG